MAVLDQVIPLAVAKRLAKFTVWSLADLCASRESSDLRLYMAVGMAAGSSPAPALLSIRFKRASFKKLMTCDH
jgi:hypothetical protein